MWLLDVNAPRALVRVLAEMGVAAETAQARGWSTLSNGDLVERAAAAGFTCLLTRDQLFAESAAQALQGVPGFAVVRLTLPQMREAEFISAFRAAWKTVPIAPRPGELVPWP